jgi:exodeoxyribonuclease V alpha subunit
LETIKGAVKRVIFSNEESGFKVMKVRIPSGPVLTFTGEFGPEIIPGTVADFHGDYRSHPKYGTNFRVASYNISHNAQKLASIRLFICAISPNIGPERAQYIVNRFGSDTIDVLENESYRLTEVEGIGKISAESLAKAWKENREKWEHERQEYTLRAFLNSLGIKERRVKKIIRYFGGGLKAEDTIRENPYKLTEIEGFGFSTADFVAKQLGVLESDPLRLRAFIFYAINVLCPQNGHLYLTVVNCVELINKYSMETNTYFLAKRTIIEEDTAESIKSLIDDGLVIEENGYLYSVKSFKAETGSASKIVAILREESDLILLTREYVDEHIANFERENLITLSKEQRDALYYFVEKKVYAITGCPGTGKTTVLKAIVDLVKKLQLDLTCMTPTGISAKKMASTIDYNAYTIHRRLGFRGDEWRFGELEKYETDVVIIDETSMVDQEVFFRLLSALRKRVHLILVGDNNQLPSVGAGNVLKELINCGEIPVINLEKIFRQDEASDIIKVAHKIKNGETDLTLFKPEPTADVFFIRETNTDIIENFIIKLAQKFKDERRIFQIITPRNDGPLSVNVLNDSLQAVLNPPPESECQLGKFIIRRGDRVIITKNDYELGVFNGEVGKVIGITGSHISVQMDDKVVDIGKELALERLKLAYTLSVHRSQGQEYPYIILPFINQFGRNMLQRNLLYTAITRAKKKVIIIGHGSALEKAISNASVQKRNTNLGERIKGCLQRAKKNFLPTQSGEPADFLLAPSKEERSSSMEDRYSLTDIIEES